MPLSSFSVVRYRSFLDETTLELRPLTLLFGYNNAGKSALTRVPPLLADSLRLPASTRPLGTPPLALDSTAARGSTFRDLATRLVANDRLRLRLNWDDVSAEVTGFSFQVRDLPDRFRQIVEELRLVGRGGQQLLHARWNPSEQAQSPDLGNSYSVELPKGHLDSLALRFTGFAPEVIEPQVTAPPRTPDQADLIKRARALCEQLRQQLAGLVTSIHWLGSVRAAPIRSKPYQSANLGRLAPDGSGILDTLTYDRETGGRVLPFVSNWYARHMGQRLDVEQVAPGNYALTLGPVGAPGVRVNLADTGEGMAQVLPVLVMGALARFEPGPPRLLAIEQPELHLHPAVHSALAGYFCELAMEPYPPRVLIETHSENFLYGVQLAILQGRLQADRVWVYWIRQLEDGRSIAERIGFDELARPQGPWPPEVFSEDLALAREIIKLRREREGV